MAHPYAESLYAALFDLDAEEELEQSLADWAQFSSAERSFATAQMQWLINERLRELTHVVRLVHAVLEEVATRPEQPPDVIDAEVLDA